MGDFRDTPTGPGTLGLVPTGGSDTGELETLGDHDVFQTTLIQGLTYTIEQRGLPTGDGTLDDAFLYIVDGSNNTLASNDDVSFSNYNSIIQFTPGATDTYFLSAASHGDHHFGTYTVRVSEGLGSAGADNIVGTAVADAVRGGEGNDTISGGNGNDRLQGENGNDIVLGGNGNDDVRGGRDVDIVRGQANNDRVFGGLNADTLIGGLNNDRFDFDSVQESTAAQRDSIIGGDGATAFQGVGGSAGNGDRIDLSTIDAIAGGGNNAFIFGGGMGVGHVWTVNSGSNTLVRANVSGSSAPELEILIADGGSFSAGHYNAGDFIL
jgi:Ca2+-binding RTX toxin-like protein